MLVANEDVISLWLNLAGKPLKSERLLDEFKKILSRINPALKDITFTNVR
jgi:hypothetical protein